jgi:hypothetical protein
MATFLANPSTPPPWRRHAGYSFQAAAEKPEQDMEINAQSQWLFFSWLNKRGNEDAQRTELLAGRCSIWLQEYFRWTAIVLGPFSCSFYNALPTLRIGSRTMGKKYLEFNTLTAERIS